MKKNFKYKLSYSYNTSIFLIKVLDAQKKYLSKVEVFSTKKILAHALALKRVGLVHSVVEKYFENYAFKKQLVLNVVLKYIFSGRPLIKKLRLFSTPGRLFHMSYKFLVKLVSRSPNSFYFVSTNRGILSGTEALKIGSGGILLYKIN